MIAVRRYREGTAGKKRGAQFHPPVAARRRLRRAWTRVPYLEGRAFLQPLFGGLVNWAFFAVVEQRPGEPRDRRPLRSKTSLGARGGARAAVVVQPITERVAAMGWCGNFAPQGVFRAGREGGRHRAPSSQSAGSSRRSSRTS